MTTFNKELFSYHGGFLTYTGDYEGRPVYEDHPNVHPSRVGTGKDLFIARFKYNRKDKAGFLSFLIKNFTVEEYAAAMLVCKSPGDTLAAKGYVSKTIKDHCKKMGYPATRAGFRKLVEDEVAARVAA